MEENNKGSAQGKGQAEVIKEPWMVNRTREVLIATGRLLDFDVSDIDPDDLREIVENVNRSKRMREADFSITREGRASSVSGSRLIYDEVMK